MKKVRSGDKLKDLMGLLDKKFGRGTIMNMEEQDCAKVKVFSTGSLGLDAALGVGGLPVGRVIEIYGPESSGKTTLCLHAIAEVQRAGGTAAIIDAEHALDLSYAGALGVDTSRLLVSQPDCGEQALEIAEILTRSDEIDLVVVDSVAALTPRAELEGEMGDSHVGLQARLMSQALRKLTGLASKHGTTVIFINQLRQKIGVMFGNPETTTGGNALKFYASVRLDIRRIGSIKNGEQAIGNRTRVKVAKNKVAPPFQTCEFDIVYGRGICQAGELLDMGVEVGVIEKSGAWYSWREGRLGQGREKAREALMADEALFRTLRAETMDKRLGRPVVSFEVEDEALIEAQAA